MPTTITRNLASDEPRISAIGKLKKGSPQVNGQYGKNKPYFRFMAHQAYFQEVFEEVYGSTPGKIQVILPYRSARANFDDWYKEYATNKQKTNPFLKRKCDGETIVQWMPPDGIRHSHEPKPCEKMTTGCGCSLKGLLSVYIRSPQHAWCLPGFNQGPVILETGSINDVAHIAQTLKYYEDLTATFGGNLAGAKFVLTRTEDTYGTPLFDRETRQAIPGRRAQKTDWMVKLYPEEEWFERVMRRATQATGVIPAPQAFPTWKDPLEAEAEVLEPVEEPIVFNPLPERELEPVLATAEPAPVKTASLPVKKVVQPQSKQTTVEPAARPTSTPQPSASKLPENTPEQVERILNRFGAFSNLLGCPMTRVDALAKQWCGGELVTLSEEMCNKLRTIILLEWTEMTYSEYGLTGEAAKRHFIEFWKDSDRQASDEEMFKAWKVFINLQVFQE